MEKEQSLQQMVLGLMDFHMQKNKVGSLPHTIYKNNSKWIMESKTKAKTIKLLDENVRANLTD